MIMMIMIMIVIMMMMMIMMMMLTTTSLQSTALHSTVHPEARGQSRAVTRWVLMATRVAVFAVRL